MRLSLFVVPMLGVLAGIGLGQLMLVVDRALGAGAGLPLLLASTAASARAVLSTVATATISVAGIAFSVSLLILQLASGQYSPRVVHGLFREPFSRRVMAVALGTFTYSLVVLRAARSPQEQGPEVLIPTLAVAVVLGGGRTPRDRRSDRPHRALDGDQRDPGPGPDRGDGRGAGRVRRPAVGARRPPGRPGHLVRAGRDGRVLQVDREHLLETVDPGGTVRMETGPGGFVFEGSPLCTVWPPPADPEAVGGRARAAVLVGTARTVQEDPAYGIRQCVDVALPGINDPTTAQDAMLHAGALLRRLIPAPQRRVHRDGTGGRCSCRTCRPRPSWSR